MASFEYSADYLLDPVTREKFMAEHWDRLPLVIPGRPDKLAGLFSRAAWESLCQARAARNAKTGTEVVTSGPDGEQREVAIAPESAPEAAQRMTVCSSRVERDNRNVARLAAALEADLGIIDKVVVNCYVSPEQHGYALHYDAQDVLVLQIEGRKRWRYSRQPAIYSPPEYPIELSDGELFSPLLGRSVHRPDEEAMAQVTLEPGSVLYLPGGTWHVASAIGSSLALTVTLVPRFAARFFCEVLQNDLLRRDAWRQRLPAVAPGDRAGAGIPAAVAKGLSEQLERFKQAVAGLDVNAFYRQWCIEIGRVEAAASRYEPSPIPTSVSRPPSGELPDPAGRAATFDPPLGPGDRLVVRAHPPLRITPDPHSYGQKIICHRAGLHVSVPEIYRPVLMELIGRSWLVARDAQEWLEGAEWSDIGPLLESLVELGFLVHATD